MCVVGAGIVGLIAQDDSSLSCPTLGVGLGALSGSVARAGIVWERQDLRLDPDNLCEGPGVDWPHFSSLEHKACLTVLQILERDSL